MKEKGSFVHLTVTEVRSELIIIRMTVMVVVTHIVLSTHVPDTVLSQNSIST